MKVNVKNCVLMTSEREIDLEKEVTMINLAVQMGVINYDIYVKELERVSKKYDLPIVIRNKNLDNGEVSIKTIG